MDKVVAVSSDITPTRWLPRLLKVAMWVFLSLFCMSIIAQAVSRSYMIVPNPRASFISMLNGSAERPYIYRGLLPMAANLVNKVTPTQLQLSLNDVIIKVTQSQPFRIFSPSTRDLRRFHNGIFTHNNIPARYLYRVTLIILMMYASLLLYCAALVSVCKTWFPAHPGVQFFTPLLALVVLIPFIDRNIKLYDFSVLASFAWCMVFMARQQWGHYLLLFTLACLNKETALLQIGVFVSAYWNRLEESTFLKLLGTQCLILVMVYHGYHLAYGNNHNTTFYHPYAIFRSLYYELGSPERVLSLVVTCWMVMAGWRHYPAVLRHSLWLLPACIGIYFVFGVSGEFRVLYEAFPALTVMAGYTLFSPLTFPYLKTAQVSES